jgi:hypothetical protein
MSDPFTEARNLLTRGLANGDEPNKPAWPPLVTYAQFEATPIEKPRPLVENVLDVASRMIFGGGSKTYKTWAMSDLALSLVVGVQWWGFPSFQAPALYVNFELKPYYMRERMRAIRLAKKLEVGPLHILNLRGYEVTLSMFKEMLLSEIEKHNILVVFVDPFYKLLGGGDERLSSEINVIMAAFDEINLKTGATVVFAAHFTKGNQAGKEAIDRLSGGGSINRDPDNLVTMTKHETEHAFTVDFTLRDFAPIDPFVVRWEYPLLVRADDLDPENLKKPIGRRVECSPTDLFGIIQINDDELTTSALVQKVESELGWSKSTTLRKLNELQKNKKVFRSKATECWNVTAR